MQFGTYAVNHVAEHVTQCSELITSLRTTIDPIAEILQLVPMHSQHVNILLKSQDALKHGF